MTRDPRSRTFGRWRVTATGRIFREGTEVEIRWQDGRVLVASSSFTQVHVAPPAQPGDDAQSLSIVSDQQSAMLLPLEGQDPEEVAREINAEHESGGGAPMSAPRADSSVAAMAFLGTVLVGGIFVIGFASRRYCSTDQLLSWMWLVGVALFVGGIVLWRRNRALVAGVGCGASLVASGAVAFSYVMARACGLG